MPLKGGDAVGRIVAVVVSALFSSLLTGAAIYLVLVPSLVTRSEAKEMVSHDVDWLKERLGQIDKRLDELNRKLDELRAR